MAGRAQVRNSVHVHLPAPSFYLHLARSMRLANAVSAWLAMQPAAPQCCLHAVLQIVDVLLGGISLVLLRSSYLALLVNRVEPGQGLPATRTSVIPPQPCIAHPVHPPCGSGCLALLINLVEHQPAWRDQLRQLQLPDTSRG